MPGSVKFGGKRGRLGLTAPGCDGLRTFAAGEEPYGALAKNAFGGICPKAAPCTELCKSCDLYRIVQHGVLGTFAFISALRIHLFKGQTVDMFVMMISIAAAAVAMVVVGDWLVETALPDLLDWLHQRGWLVPKQYRHPRVPKHPRLDS